MERHKKKKLQSKMDKEDYENGSRLYFESIKTLPKLFIETRKLSEPYVYLDIRNLILLSIYESHRLDKWIHLNIVQKDKPCSECSLKKNLLLRYKSAHAFLESTHFQMEDSSTSCNNILEESRVHPSILVEDKRMVICGVSNVLRFMFKYSICKIEESKSTCSETEKTTLFNLKKLMGFRGGCLQACAESSIWTKFCEVDMVSSVNEISRLQELIQANTPPSELQCPETLKRFENHLGLPVKIHNFKRVIQSMKQASQEIENSADSDQCLDKDLLNDDLKHEFAEGPTLLLSDLVLYPSFHVFILFIGEASFARLFPRAFQWHDKVGRQFSVLDKLAICRGSGNDESTHVSWYSPDVPVESLYLRDTNRYKPSLRQFTRQYEVEEALGMVKALNINPLEVTEEDPNFNWEEIPVLAHPEGGSLPLSRLQRKCDQLASMVFYALKIYKAKHDQSKSTRRFRIVDFCSGGGHVGILLAWLLPESEVVLVENKDESLRRAQERIVGLSLSNVLAYQSNLDYFESTFDLGLALHACGTATDLVIDKCVKVNASFVSCPCCYGAMQENHILSYPRSTIFSEISLRHYLVLCHASDQTQAETKEKASQGKLCMQIVDTDRCLHAAENRYDVKLCKMVPETASPKNHILVAVSSDD